MRQRSQSLDQLLLGSDAILVIRVIRGLLLSTATNSAKHPVFAVSVRVNRHFAIFRANNWKYLKYFYAFVNSFHTTEYSLRISVFYHSMIQTLMFREISETDNNFERQTKAQRVLSNGVKCSLIQSRFNRSVAEPHNWHSIRANTVCSPTLGPTVNYLDWHSYIILALILTLKASLNVMRTLFGVRLMFSHLIIWSIIMALMVIKFNKRDCV